MHCIRHVTEDLIWIGGNDRQHPLFESTHPVPRGMSFNSYLLLDETGYAGRYYQHPLHRLPY